MEKEIILLLICGGLFIFIIALLPMILLWFNRSAVRTLSANATQTVNANASLTPEVNETNSRNRKESSRHYNINTREATIYTAAFIVCTTILALIMFYCSHKIVGDNVKATKVDWIKTDSLKIKSGPNWFFYDSKSGQLQALHQISDNEKTLLISLVESGDKNFQSYTQAVDKLAFDSNNSNGSNFSYWLILLYAMAGLIGVQLRTINNFVGNACFKNDFNFHVWWPWYLVRPILGFITGAIVFLLIDGRHLLDGKVSTGLSTAILSIAFLGGFSTDDFYELLRKLSKKIFGTP